MEEDNTMYLAYVKNVTIGEEVGGVVFTETKAQMSGLIVLLRKYGKKKDMYIQWEGRNIFHADWLKCIVACEGDAIGIGQFRQSSMGHKHRIVSYKNNGFSSIINDVETGDKITNASNYWYGDNIYARFGSSYVQNIGTTEVCETCGRIYLPMYNSPHRNMCVTCFEKIAIKCNHCGNHFIKKDQNTLQFDGKTMVLCDICLSKVDKCDVCGKPCFSDNEYQIFDEQCICNTCFSKQSKVRCDICGTYYDSHEIVKRKDGRNICRICHLDTIFHSKIREYNYKPNPVFYNNDGDKSRLYFGIELEINTPNGGGNRDTFNRYIEDKVNYPDELIYCKFDRSIGNDGMAGFEIVTHPMSYPYIIGQGRDKIESIMALSKMGCRSFKTDTCGMHVHMSKNQFNTNHLYRFLDFFFNNKDFNVMISERTNISKVDEFCSFEPDYSLRDLAENMSNSSERHARHKAINLACPSTVEVRIFRGTLNYSKFMKNLEYCKAVFDFTKSSSDSNNTVTRFKEYVITNSNMYENLYRFLDKKNAI